MKIHGLMVIRDEDDIASQSLAHLLAWIDALYVLDLGSTDSTWEIINEMAARDKRVVPFKSVPYRFDDSIRGYLFESFRARFREGDWIFRLDADEFYHVNPRQFVAEQVLPHESCVYLAWYYFRLTTGEVSTYESGQISLAAERQKPIEERRRHYKITDYAEPRMFRYRRSMKWPASRPGPYNSGYVARERIPIRHYPHRDPLQMEKRYRLRAAMKEIHSDAGPHWALKDWRKDVIELDPATGHSREWTLGSEGLSASRGHTAGSMRFWHPGTELPSLAGSEHLPPASRRAIQRLIYPHGVRLMDRFRTAWPPGSEPPLLPENITTSLLATRSSHNS